MTRDAKEAVRQEAIDRLKKLIKPGDKVYTTVRHVSRSGMQRVIDTHVIIDNAPVWIGYTTATALERRYNRDKNGVVVDGCGMDMTFEVVYELGRVLWPDGFGCVGEKCNSNDHRNGDRNYTPHENHITSPDHVCARKPETCTAKKHWHRDGGYALQREQL